MEYGAAVWDPHTKACINKVEMVQRRAARYVLGRYRNTSSVGEMLDQLEWETLEERQKYARLAMFYKMTNGLAAINAEKYVTPATTRGTRGGEEHHYTVPHSRVDYHKFSFFPRTIREWNALAPEVVGASSLDSFKSKLRGTHGT